MLFFDTEQLMLDYSREVRNSYSRKKYTQQQPPQQLEPHVHRGCDAEKMMRVYAKKVSPTLCHVKIVPACPSVQVGLVTTLYCALPSGAFKVK